MSKDRNIAELWGAGQGYIGAGSAMLAGWMGTPAQDFVSAIDRAFWWGGLGEDVAWPWPG
jgi:hypothetical protein